MIILGLEVDVGIHGLRSVHLRQGPSIMLLQKRCYVSRAIFMNILIFL